MLNYLQEYYNNNSKKNSPAPSGNSKSCCCKNDDDNNCCNDDNCNEDVSNWVILVYLLCFMIILIVSLIALMKCWNTFPLWAGVLFLVLIFAGISYSYFIQQIGLFGQLYIILYWLMNGC